MCWNWKNLIEDMIGMKITQKSEFNTSWFWNDAT